MVFTDNRASNCNDNDYEVYGIRFRQIAEKMQDERIHWQVNSTLVDGQDFLDLCWDNKHLAKQNIEMYENTVLGFVRLLGGFLKKEGVSRSQIRNISKMKEEFQEQLKEISEESKMQVIQVSPKETSPYDVKKTQQVQHDDNDSDLKEIENRMLMLLAQKNAQERQDRDLAIALQASQEQQALTIRTPGVKTQQSQHNNLVPYAQSQHNNMVPYMQNPQNNMVPYTQSQQTPMIAHNQFQSQTRTMTTMSPYEQSMMIANNPELLAASRLRQEAEYNRQLQLQQERTAAMSSQHFTKNEYYFHGNVSNCTFGK